MVNKDELNNPFIKVTWEDSPENFTQEKIKRLKSHFKKKYNSERVNVLTRVSGVDTPNNPQEVTENVIDKEYQKRLVKEFLKEQEVIVDWDKFVRLDNRVESNIQEEENTTNKKWSVKWVEFSNFLSFGEGNKIDFTKYPGITAVDSSPANFGGKTTLTVDLLLFLFFNVTTKSSKAIEVFNRFTDKNRVLVSGEVEIDGDNFIIERGVIRRQTKKGEWSVKTELNLSKRLSDGTSQNLQGEQRRETEEFLKNSIGTMDDFLLTILTTSNNLENLLEAKPTQRGQILTRFVGLEKLKKKEENCKEIYSEWNKKIISNHYNINDLTTDIVNLKEEIRELQLTNESSSKEIKTLELKYGDVVTYKEKLISSQHNDINPDLVKVNPETLEEEIGKLGVEGTKLKHKLDLIILDKPSTIYSEDEYKLLIKENKTLIKEDLEIKSEIKNINKLIKNLEEGKNCPMCKQLLEDVDHTQEIKDNQVNLKEIVEDSKKIMDKLENSEQAMGECESIKSSWEGYEKESLKKIKVELDIKENNITRKEKTSLLKEWESNKSKLEENRVVEKKLVSARTLIETIIADRDQLKSKTTSNNSKVTQKNGEILDKTSKISEIKKEEGVDKVFKSYLIAYGKNGISKLILRNTIPYLNSELNRLLSDSCEFTLQLRINDRNELEFWMVDNGTGIEKLMSSGSGYEKTIASLALRSVLSKVCALPKPNIVCFDEAFGKVSDENLELVGRFFTKIKDYFERIFVISHNPLVKDWCDQTITVKKENNVSRVI
jgi:DNA repair exonuclease SbcCD ATPase subunit